MSAAATDLIVRDLGIAEYITVWRAMQGFTQQRSTDQTDELWLVEHPAVYTLGLNGRHDPIPDPRGIPILNVDRGGQLTFHGPGQIILYPLLDLTRKKLGVKRYVAQLEQLIIDYLQTYQIVAERRSTAPGVYVHHAKIASLGLRIRRGACYHGIAFNVDMDLEPFRQIAPCGLTDTSVTQLRELLPTQTTVSLARVKQDLQRYFGTLFGYNPIPCVDPANSYG